MGDINKISITDVNVCEIINTEDIVMHIYIENKLYSYTYILPFIYSDNAFQLNEEAIITLSELLNYTLIDVDGGGPYKAFVFRQKYDNTFEWEEDLDEQLNNYDNESYNQDVETVINYVEMH